MNSALRSQIGSEAQAAGITVAESFYTKLDGYISTHFRSRPERDQVTIQAYLAQAGIRIAKTEGKNVAEAEDAKAAIWLFHLPEDPDDPCAAAGNRALTEENRRQPLSRGILTERFRQFLNQL